MIGEVERVEGLLDGTYRISLLTRSKPHLDGLTGKAVEISIKEKKARRSLDANAYYWVLLGKLADKLRYSKPYMHNLMLKRYGQDLVIDGKLAYVVLPETEEATKKVEEAETFHLRPTSETRDGKDGKTYRTYILLRGSHEYNTAEMAILIEGIVSECKEHDIETMTPEELERMMKAYEQKKQGV